MSAERADWRQHGLPIDHLIAAMREVEDTWEGARVSGDDAGNYAVTVGGQRVGWIDTSDGTVHRLEQ